MITYRWSDYCGAKAMSLKPPRVYFLEASCKLHDEGYLEGGNEIRRLVCDLFFYTHMINDINKLCRWRLRKYFYISWASTYFILVRLFGFLFFNYRQISIWASQSLHQHLLPIESLHCSEQSSTHLTHTEIENQKHL